MSAPRRALWLLTRAGAYIVHFIALFVAVGIQYTLIYTWVFVQPAYGDIWSWLMNLDTYLRSRLRLPPGTKKAKEQEPGVKEVLDGGVSDFLWSANAAWILAVFEPWEPGNGQSEEAIRGAEATIGARLPERLRSFYRSWGRREDITGSRDYLILPDERLVFSDAVVIAVENQGTIYWSILRESLSDPDPPVHFAEIDWSDGSDTPSVGPWRLSHERVSDFLDALVLAHAFAKGAVHGADAPISANDLNNLMRKIAISAQWTEIVIRSVPWSIIPDGMERRWSVFVGDSVVIDCSFGLLIAANSDDKIDAVANDLQIAWQDRW
jgi:hypothetical protein